LISAFQAMALRGPLLGQRKRWRQNHATTQLLESITIRNRCQLPQSFRKAGIQVMDTTIISILRSELMRHLFAVHPDAPGGACNSLAKPFSSVKPVEIPKCGSVAVRPNPPNTEFRRFYERGDLPIAIEHSGVGNKIQWKVCYLFPYCGHLGFAKRCLVMPFSPF
jgi:hypothetical protein